MKLNPKDVERLLDDENDESVEDSLIKETVELRKKKAHAAARRQEKENRDNK